jgi:hypothetical protein
MGCRFRSFRKTAGHSYFRHEVTESQKHKDFDFEFNLDFEVLVIEDMLKVHCQQTIRNLQYYFCESLRRTFLWCQFGLSKAQVQPRLDCFGQLSRPLRDTRPSLDMSR